MLLALLVTVSLDAQTPPPRPVPAGPMPHAEAVVLPTHDEAARMADSGDLEGALRAFQQIAAANPDDRAARLWIANLQLEMHHPERAESVYRSILLEEPANLRAMVGVGSSLIERDDYQDALDVLASAESTAPQDPTVLVALGRAHLGAGHLGRSVRYLERAVALAPTAANRLLLEHARSVHDHRVEAVGVLETFTSGQPDTHAVDVTLNLRTSDTFRVVGRGQREDKFGARDTRAGGGIEWRWRRSTMVTGQVMVGTNSLVLAREEVFGGLGYTTGPAVIAVDYRFLNFVGEHASIVGPAVHYTATSRLELDLRYALVITELAGALGSDRSPSAAAQATYRFGTRTFLAGGYARGIENFQAISIDRIGLFDANTLLARVRFDLPSVTSVQGDYEHQWRPGGFTMSRLTVSLVQRF
jgi:tetratricopeptide (TPR) repeat protein